jgi:hypothetical protein
MQTRFFFNFSENYVRMDLRNHGNDEFNLSFIPISHIPQLQPQTLKSLKVSPILWFSYSNPFRLKALQKYDLETSIGEVEDEG